MQNSPKKDNQKKVEAKLKVILYDYFFVVVLFVFVTIVLSGYIFLITPKYTAITASANTEEEKKMKELEDLKAYLDRLRRYREEYNQISSLDKERIDSMVAGEYLSENAFIDMEKLIASRGLILNSIDVSSAPESQNSETNKKSNVGEAVIRLNITGVDYGGLKDLLTIIEGSMRLMDVKLINFSPSKSFAELQISTYYLK